MFKLIHNKHYVKINMIDYILSYTKRQYGPSSRRGVQATARFERLQGFFAVS